MARAVHPNGNGRRRSQHCIDDHGDDRPRTDRGSCRLCYAERGARRAQERRDWVKTDKLAKGCADCGYVAHHAALQYHHRDPAEKTTTIGAMQRSGWDVFLAEVAKCDVLCANCHCLRHHG